MFSKPAYAAGPGAFLDHRAAIWRTALLAVTFGLCTPTLTQTISTVGGTTFGFSGDGGPATAARLNLPEGVFVDAAGNLFIADHFNNRVRKVAPAITAVVEVRDESLPQSFTLSQNYPNPFNPETTIRFDLPRSEEIELAVYDLTGQKVATLALGLREAGTYALRWDARDDDGRDLASGVYLYRLETGERVTTRKLLLLR